MSSSSKRAPDQRALLPLQSPSPVPALPSPTADNSTQGRVLKRKRPHTKVACNQCRAKKWACDGDRPKCSSCSDRNIVCVYTSLDKSETHVGTLRRENETLRQYTEPLTELMNLLQIASSDLAQILLLKLRYCNASSVLRFIKGGISNDHIQLSTQNMARGMLARVESDLKVEWMLQHPIAYPVLGPVMDKLPSTAISVGLTQRLPPLGKPSMKRHESNNSSHSQSGDSCVGMSDLSPYECDNFQEIRRPNNYMVGQGGLQFQEVDPRPPPGYHDPRLSDLNIGFWTNVPISNELAAEAISLYLATDHPFLGLFDANLVISSLVECDLKFCSPFLVSSLLAYATQGYNAIDPTSLAQSYHFEQEAESLCDIELQGGSNSLSSLAAFSLLWASHLCHGSGKDGVRSLNAGIEMAKRMKLFGVPDSLSVSNLGFRSMLKDERSATTHTAWGCFNMSMMQTIYATPQFNNYPPTLPIPGDLESQSNQIPFVGEGNTYQSLCKLFKVASQTLVFYQSPSSTPALELAFSEINKLLALADRLPSSMSYANGTPSHVFVFHTWYHALIIDIIRPFLSSSSSSSSFSTSTSTSSSTSPHALFDASIKQLKQIVLVYSSYDHARNSIWWHVGLLYISNAVLSSSSLSWYIQPECRTYFLLCLFSYKSTLGSCFGMVRWIIPGLLALAVREGKIGSKEAHDIKARFLCYEDHGEKGVNRRPKGEGAGFVLNLDAACGGGGADWSAAQADKLATEFDDMSIFDEFTSGIV